LSPRPLHQALQSDSGLASDSQQDPVWVAAESHLSPALPEKSAMNPFGVPRLLPMSPRQSPTSLQEQIESNPQHPQQHPQALLPQPREPSTMVYSMGSAKQFLVSRYFTSGCQTPQICLKAFLKFALRVGSLNYPQLSWNSTLLTQSVSG